jgi:hypothetical protein
MSIRAPKILTIRMSPKNKFAILSKAALTDLIKYQQFMETVFWRENVLKIVPVQVPTKLEIWQNCVAFVFVITYVLQVLWLYIVHILIIDHRPLLFMGVPRFCALTSSSWGRGKRGLDSLFERETISCSSITGRNRRVILYVNVELAELSNVAWAQINKNL